MASAPPKTAKHLRPRISVSGRVSLRTAAEIRQHLRHQCIRRARIREQHVAGAGIVEVFYRVALAVARHPFDQCRAHPRCRPMVAPETSSSGPVHRSTAIAAFLHSSGIVESRLHHRQPGNAGGRLCRCGAGRNWNVRQRLAAMATSSLSSRPSGLEGIDYMCSHDLSFLLTT